MSEFTYTHVASPVGNLLVVAQGDAVIRVAFENEGFEEVLSQYPDALEDTARPVLAAARSQLDEYFGGSLKTFDIPVVAQNVSDFRKKVLEAISEIPYGETVTYSELASRAGNPDAVRAAGTACGANAVPILVPCHRVTRTDGSTGSYLGGEKAKAWLLTHEREMSVQS